MRVIIAGSRGFDNYLLLAKETMNVFKMLKSEGFDTKRENVEVISGTANGADKLGEKFAQEFDLTIKRFPADWSFGKSAGYRRNEDMAIYAKEDNGVLIAFWDTKSKGTKHMIDLANKHKLRVFVVNY